MKNNTKQVVVLDESNENEIIVEAGLAAGDKVLLSVPEGAEEMRFTGVELVEVIRQKEAEKKRLEEEQQKQREEEQIQRNLRRRMQPPGDAPPAGVRPAGNG